MPVPLVPPQALAEMQRRAELRQEAMGDVVRGPWGVNTANKRSGVIGEGGGGGVVVRPPQYQKATKQPSAKDSAQTSMSPQDAQKAADALRLPQSELLKRQEKMMSSLKQSTQAFDNKWSAYAKKQGFDVNKALQAVKEYGANFDHVPTDSSFKYILAILRQRGVL